MEIEFKENYPLKKLTSFKIGGEAKKIYFPKNQQEFIYLLKTIKNPLVFGNWSNVLISSKGINQEIISTSKLINVEFKGTKLTVDCGVKGPLLSQEALKKSLSGFEFMISFPGTIGGNIYMNASAHAQSISDCLVSVCAFDTDLNEVVLLEKNKLEFGYRTSIFQTKPYIILSAEFELKKESKEEIEALMNRNLEFRKTHQPSLATPNAGSIFKNPQNDSAGRLLDKAGVKGLNVGGAKIWENHANFIVNENDATSQDVLELMLKMFNLVKEKYTISLAPEVKYFGEKTNREEELCNILYNQK